MDQVNKIDYSVVVPVYNGSETLIELYRRLKSVFKKLKKNFEVIFVNDYSTDNSLSILEKIHFDNNNVIVVNLFSNFGQQNALMCGFQYASGSNIITMDDDLQNPPEEIPKLIDKLSENFDAVIGTYKEKKDIFYKNWGSVLFRKLNHKIFNVSNNLKFSSFRIIKKDIIDEIKTNKTSYPYISGMLVQITDNIDNVVLKHEKRKYGKSNYTFKKLVNISLNLLINHSTIPLKFFSYIGLAVSGLSLIFGLGFMIKQLIYGFALPGWTSIVVLVSFYNALLLVIFFILGIYVSRILKESTNQKQFSVKNVLK